MNTKNSANISDRDDVAEGVLTPAERLPQVKEMLEMLARRIGPQEKGEFFSEAPAPLTHAEVVAELERIAHYAKTGVYR